MKFTNGKTNQDKRYEQSYKINQQAKAYKLRVLKDLIVSVSRNSNKLLRNVCEI